MKQRYEQSGVAMTCRSFQEYSQMFGISEKDLKKGRVLDVAAGASSFVAQCYRRGVDAVAVDPVYQHSAKYLLNRGKQEIEESTQKIDAAMGLFDWNYYGSLEQHRCNREKALQQFFYDFDQNKRSQSLSNRWASPYPCLDYEKEMDGINRKLNKERNRYVPGSLPQLPFADETFSLILCSHFLILYHEHLGKLFQLEAIKEMLRVCQQGGEIRVYPLVGFDGERYATLEELIDQVENMGGKADLRPTPFRFLKGAEEMLVIGKEKDSYENGEKGC